MNALFCVILTFVVQLAHSQFDESQYDYVGLKGSKLILVSKNDKFGFVNHQGKIKIPLIYDAAWDFSFGLAAVKQKDKWGFINEKGKVAIPFRYDYADYFSEKIAPIKYNNQWYHIDKKGNIVRKILVDETIPTYDLFEIKD
ncbi:MAG: WG repeat-containing protein [Bacteroidota bacterium]|nr:WG repeat-containing protein [Bacteroidota bacterium]